MLSHLTEHRRYARKPGRADVLVALMASPGGIVHRDGHDLGTAFEAAGERFGFSTRLGVRLEDLPEAPAAAMSHLIAILDQPFDGAFVERLGAMLGRWSSASVAFAYEGEAQMYACERQVEACKRAFANRLNVLFPDETQGAVRYVSPRKLLDNAVCDTVRVKYVPQHVAAAITPPEAVSAYFRAAGDVYAREHMYLRAPTDGYIAARRGRTDEFFITATFTDKTALDPARISLVHGYDRATNTLTYSGPYLPSSDAVEAAILLARAPAITHLLHTHASKLFTRNPAYRSRVLVPQLPYGEPALGDALAEALERVGDGFVIMEEHGDIFAGSGEPESFLEGVVARCREARRAGA